MASELNLRSFIRSIGVDEAATLFGEKPRTVMGWMYGERVPRKETAAKIVERTKGKVSYAGIYGEPRQ